MYYSKSDSCNFADKLKSEFATAKQALIKENGDLLNVYKESIQRNDLLNKELGQCINVFMLLILS